MNSKFPFVITSHGKYNITLSPGVYSIECWGAEGGIGMYDGKPITLGGKGAYAAGVISINNKHQLFLYVGGKGEDGSAKENTYAKGGFNGGGTGGADTRDDEGSGGGGGATDIRLIDDNTDQMNSLYSRIIVAAGGSGSSLDAYGAPGGDITGYISGATGNSKFNPSSTNQEKGYSLGVGENGKDDVCTPSSGSGGGYWGGLAQNPACENEYRTVSSSGSSFISGYPGCKAVNANGEIQNHPMHYSNIAFMNPIIRNGLQLFYSPNGTEEVGHSGDGAIVIKLISCFRGTCYGRIMLRLSLFFATIILNCSHSK